MNEVFTPSIVISIGPSAKKALDFLNNMLIDIPEYLKKLIEICNIEDMENIEEYLQEVIDSKILSANNINRLVDLGYKIRTENTSSIKVNIYLFWDIYSIDFPIKNLIECLFKVNYCVVDKTKHSGVSLFVFPMLDKEWKYNQESSLKKIDTLKEVVNYLGSQDNMINIDSKVYITHTISNDGLRVSKVELEYILAIITYLTILPSEEPLLKVYNKRLLKYEGNFKVGTIGISTLTIFKDKIKEEFSAYLLNDLITHAISYEESINYMDYSSSNLLNGNNIKNIISENMPIIECTNNKLVVPDKYKIKIKEEKIWNRNPQKYPLDLESAEDILKRDYIRKIKEDIDKNKEFIINKTLEEIDNNLISIIKNYSLKCGKTFLENMLDKIDKESVNFIYKDIKGTQNLKKELKKKTDNYHSFIGYIFKVILIALFCLYSSINIIKIIPNINIWVKASIIILLIVSILFVAALEYLSDEKTLLRLIDNYIERIYINQGELLRKYLGKSITEYYDYIREYIKKKNEEVDEFISNISNIKVDIDKFKQRKDEDVEILITDLFNFNDRKRFYEANKGDIPAIYSRFIGEIEVIDKLKSINIRNQVNKFSEEITDEYVNIDFYDYAKVKWEENLEKEVSKWIDKALIKSKELLQYNKEDELEEHKLFVGSGNFINATKDIIRRKLDKYTLTSIRGKDIYTNCISIVNLTLGIGLNKITPFINLERRNKGD